MTSIFSVAFQTDCDCGAKDYLICRTVGCHAWISQTALHVKRRDLFGGAFALLNKHQDHASYVFSFR